MQGGGFKLNALKRQIYKRETSKRQIVVELQKYKLNKGKQNLQFGKQK